MAAELTPIADRAQHLSTLNKKKAEQKRNSRPKTAIVASHDDGTLFLEHLYAVAYLLAKFLMI